MAKWKEYFYNEKQMLEVLRKTFETNSIHSFYINQKTYLRGMYLSLEKNGSLTKKQITQVKRNAQKFAMLGHIIYDFNNKSDKISKK
jgi:hypothetical protein